MRGQGEKLRDSYVMHKNLSDMRKVSIRRQDGQTVLHRTGRDPEIVRGDWSADPPKPIQNDGVPLSCFLVQSYDMDPRRAQKLSECVPVFFEMAAIPESGLQFT